MKKYKSSYYNYVIKDGNDSIVFNARNCALVKVNNIFMGSFKILSQIHFIRQ